MTSKHDLWSLFLGHFIHTFKGTHPLSYVGDGDALCIKRNLFDHCMPHSLCCSSPEWALGKVSLSMREYGTPFPLQHFSQGKKFNYPKKSFQNSWVFCQSINKTINPKSHESHEISDSLDQPFKFCLLLSGLFPKYTCFPSQKKKKFQSLEHLQQWSYKAIMLF